MRERFCESPTQLWLIMRKVFFYTYESLFIVKLVEKKTNTFSLAMIIYHGALVAVW